MFQTSQNSVLGYNSENKMLVVESLAQSSLATIRGKMKLFLVTGVGWGNGGGGDK